MKEIGNNGRLAMVFLIVIGYAVYYSYLFPSLVSKNEQLFWLKRDMSPVFDSQSDSTKCKIDLIVKISKNMIEYLDGKIIVTIINHEQSCKGAVIIAGNLLDENEKKLLEYPIFRILSEDKEPTSYAHNLVLPYDLKPYNSLSVPIWVNLPNREAKNIEFTFYNVNQENFVPSKRDQASFLGPPTCPGDIKNIENESENSQDRQPLSRICASINSEGVIKQSSIDHLLLPPWSNGVIPLVIIAVVWLTENSMPRRFKAESHKVDNFVPCKFIGIFFGALFLLIVFTLGIACILLSDKTPLIMIILLPIFMVILMFFLTRFDAKQQAEEDQTIKRLEDRMLGLENKVKHFDVRLDGITSMFFDKLVHLETLCVEEKKQSNPVNIQSIDADKSQVDFVCLNCGHAYTSMEIKDKLTPCVQCGQYTVVEQDHPSH